jgi:hypothetical protein
LNVEINIGPLQTMKQGVTAICQPKEWQADAGYDMTTIRAGAK